MQIIFIHHSCFLVEVDDKVLIFDYFDGNKLNGYTFTGKIPEYEPDTKIYMFASHSHKDHYDMDILRWAEKYENIDAAALMPSYLRLPQAERERLAKEKEGRTEK